MREESDDERRVAEWTEDNGVTKICDRRNRGSKV